MGGKGDGWSYHDYMIKEIRDAALRYLYGDSFWEFTNHPLHTYQERLKAERNKNKIFDLARALAPPQN